MNQILRRQTSRSHYGSKVPAVTVTVFKYRNKIGKLYLPLIISYIKQLIFCIGQYKYHEHIHFCILKNKHYEYVFVVYVLYNKNQTRWVCIYNLKAEWICIYVICFVYWQTNMASVYIQYMNWTQTELICIYRICFVHPIA